MIRSLQSRLLIRTLTATTLVLCIAGVLVFALTRSMLLRDFDHAMESKARAMTALVEEERGRIELELKDGDMPEFSRRTRPEYYELRLADGAFAARSPSLVGHLQDGISAPDHEMTLQTVTLPDGRPGRIVMIRFIPRSEDEDKGKSGTGPQAIRTPVVLAVARDTLDLDHTLAHIRFVLISIGAITVLTISSLLAGVVRAGLRPLRELATQIAALNETILSARLSIKDVPSELDAVVERLNELLAGLEKAFTRERTLTADVAHELRTPLAGLRSTLEVTLTKERDCPAYKEALANSLLIARQMQEMVDNLLTLARAESGQLRCEMQPLDITALARESWKPFAARAAARSISVHWLGPLSCVVLTDREKLLHVLRNLLENAVSYANDGGEILLETAGSDGEGQITIANTGCTLSKQETVHVFDRFWRKDPSRRDTGVHSGLGLALAKRITELLGGTIRADADGGAFRVSVTLPPASEQARA